VSPLSSPRKPRKKGGIPSSNGKVRTVSRPPRKPKNVDVRPREYLTGTEVESLMDAAAGLGRHGHRDATMILIAFRHGLRVSELIALRWDIVDLAAGLLHVTRLKHGVNAPHPLRGTETRALRRLQRENPSNPYVFVTERETAMTPSNFRKMLARAGREAGFEFLVHPHMLRHYNVPRKLDH
jgi:integrase